MELVRRRRANSRQVPLSVTRPELLVDRSDFAFRGFIQTMFSIAGTLGLIRERVGSLYGISGAQFSILMGTLHLQRENGVSISGLAGHLHLRATFVTTQTNKLRESGLILKRNNPADRRGVLLRLSRSGADLLDQMIPLVSDLNDRIFAGLSREEFLALRDVNERLADSTDDALTVVERIAKRSPRRSA